MVEPRVEDGAGGILSHKGLQGLGKTNNKSNLRLEIEMALMAKCFVNMSSVSRTTNNSSSRVYKLLTVFSAGTCTHMQAHCPTLLFMEQCPSEAFHTPH